MVQKYEFPISPNYVAHWDLEQAGRELRANYMDSGQPLKCGREGDMYVYENGIDEAIPMGSMVLGCSTKTSYDSDTVGQFGEGLKLAIIVILRDGDTGSIVIYNWDEKWTFSFEHSSTWGAEVLVMEVEKLPEVSETFRIELPCKSENVKSRLEALSIESFIGLSINKFVSENATMYFTNEYDGEVFVGGLLIDNPGTTRYILNIKPSEVSLNRERSEIDSEALYECYKNLVHDMMDSDYVDEYRGYIFEILRSGSFAERLVDDLEKEDYIKSWAAELLEKSRDKVVCSSENESDVAKSLGEEAVLLSRIERKVVNNYRESMEQVPKQKQFYSEFQPLSAPAEVNNFIEELQTALVTNETTEQVRDDEALQRATKRLKAMSSKWFSLI